MLNRLLWRIRPCHHRIHLLRLLDLDLEFLCLQILLLVTVKIICLGQNLFRSFINNLVILVLSWCLRWILIVQIRIKDKMIAKNRILWTEVFTHRLVVYILNLILGKLLFLNHTLDHLLWKEVILFSRKLNFFTLFLWLLNRNALHQILLVSNLNHQVIHHEMHISLIALNWLIKVVRVFKILGACCCDRIIWRALSGRNLLIERAHGQVGSMDYCCGLRMALMGRKIYICLVSLSFSE